MARAPGEPAAKRQKLNGHAPSILNSRVLSLAGSRLMRKSASTLAEIWAEDRCGEVTAEEDTLCSVKVTPNPFRSLQCDGLFDDELLARVRQQLLETVEYHYRTSDLFSYHGSNDLMDPNTVPKDTPLAGLRDALYSAEIMDFLSGVTGIELDRRARPDLSSHIYKPGDYLACHDDDIADAEQGRRIAFILYLVEEDWSDEDGGQLQLYDIDSTAQPTVPPGVVMPRFNRLALFETTSISYHDVAEVVGTRDRLSISGWYSGPLRSRLANNRFDHTFLRDFDDTLEECINPAYLTHDRCEELREVFVDEGQVALPDFLLPSVYAEWREALHATLHESEPVGPATVRRYHRTQDAKLSALAFLRSARLANFLTILTDETPIAHAVEGRLFTGGCYTLLHDQALQPDGLDICLSMGDGNLPAEAGGMQRFIMSAEHAIEGEEDELLVQPPAANTLYVVNRDKGTIKYVKRISELRANGGYRLDVEAIYQLKPSDEEGS